LGELKVRIGVQSGEMVSGSVGAKRRRDYTVLGDPVNVASRLEGRAPDDGILIGDSTYKVVADSVHVERLDPMQLRNRKERVVPYRVLGRTNDQS